MVDSNLGILEPAVPTKRIDAEQVVVGIVTVQRERIQVTGLAATDIAAVTAANGLEVDVTRVVPGTGAINLGKAEDAAHADGDVGVMALGVRNDAVTPLAGDGDYHPMMFNVNGRLLVQTEGGGGGTAATDDAPFTLAVDSGTPAMGFFGDAAPDSVDDGDAGVVRMSANRNLYATLRDAAGNERGANVTAANALEVDGSASIQPISNNDVISTNNSTIAVFAGGATFTGVGDDVLGYSKVTIQIDASHDSAVDGMTFQFSIDNVNWDDIYLFTYTAADGARRFQFPVTAQFFRFVYTNGVTLQTHFRVQTILHRTDGLTTIHRLSDAIDPDRSSQLTKAAIIAQADGSGDFITVDATAGGNLKTSVEEFNGVAPSLNSGVVDAGTLRVVLPTDQPIVSVDGSSVTQPISAVALPLPAGAATSALQLPDGHNVTVDNAAGGAAVNVQDGGNSLTVDAPIGTPVNVQVGDGTDALGIYTEDAPAVPDPIGTAQIIVRQDTPAGLTSLDGDNVARRGTDFGAAYTQIVTSAGAFVDTFGGGTQFAVDDPLGATPTGTLAITRRDSVLSALTPVDDDAEVLRVDGFGSLWNALSADDGARIPADSTDGLKVNLGVDNDVTIASESAGLALAANQLADGHNVTVDNANLTVINAGTFAVQDSEKVADNTAFIDGTTPVQPAGFIFDEVAGTALTENDAAAARIDAKRAQVLVIEDATTRGQRANVSAAGALDVEVTTSALPAGAAISANQQTDALTDTELRATAVPISAASLPLPAGAATSALQLPDGHAVTAVGTIATDADGSAVDPVLVGGIAQEIDDSAPPNRVSAENDVAHLSMSRDGAIFVAGGGPQQWFSSNLYTGTQTDDSLHAAPGAGLQLMITDIYFAAEAAVDFTLEADDAPDVFLYGYFASGEGDGVAQSFKTPIPVGDNRALLFTSSAAVNHIVVVSGYIQPV